MNLSRRRLISFSGASLAVGAIRPAHAAALDAECVRLERELGGRVGLAVIDTGSGARVGHRSAERFPLCSTFRFSLRVRSSRGSTTASKPSIGD